MWLLGFVNPCLVMQQSHSRARAAPRWDCDPERGSSPFALGTLATTELLTLSGKAGSPQSWVTCRDSQRAT